MDQRLCVMAGFDSETQRHLNEIKKKLVAEGYEDDDTEEKIPPHIILGTFSILNGNGIVQLIEKTAAELSRFAISFNHFGIRNRNQDLILSLSASQKLLDLKRRFGEAYDWAPAVTLFTGEAERVYTSVPFIAQAFEEFDGILDRLYLYEFFPAVPLLEARLEGEVKIK